MALRDKYRSYNELSAAEIEHRDYRRIVRQVQYSNTAVIAPHGGGIEYLTSMICRAIAGDDVNYYLFEGIKQRKNIDLHITSHNFDEPLCLNLISECDNVIAIHGFRAKNECVIVGGLDTSLQQKFTSALCKAGIDVRNEGHNFPASNPNNICNRGKANKGVQIEISGKLRRSENINILIQTIRKILLVQYKLQL